MSAKKPSRRSAIRARLARDFRVPIPFLLWTVVGLVAVYESQARREDAQAVVQEILHLNSNLSAELLMELPATRLLAPGAARRAEIVEHLRNAGLP